MSADRITPLEAPSPIHALTEEVRQLKMQTSRLADAAMIATSKIPELEQKIARIQVFHQWFPTMAIAVAIVVRIWLR